jgi:hypothetical protein
MSFDTIIKGGTVVDGPTSQGGGLWIKMGRSRHGLAGARARSTLRAGRHAWIIDAHTY